MSQELLRRVQALAMAGRFDEARALLQESDHPDAPQLAALIDEMAQTAAQAVPGSGQPATPAPQEEPSDLLARLARQREALDGPQETVLLRSEGDRRVYDAGTYEMLWDCQFCGTKKLLGLTHRFCPNCGAPQNPDARYYPAEDEMVAVKDHVYVGEDRTCPACDALNSASAEFCGNCGSPLTDAARARKLAEERRGDRVQFASSGSRDVVKEAFDAEMQRVGVQPADRKAARRGPRWLPIALILLAVVVCGGILAAVLITNDTAVSVSGHAWEREIRIEQYSAVQDSAWCDSMPGGAYNVSRRREVRSTNRIPDGESCEMVRRDNGDGTFRMERECVTTYREEPVYDDRCYFTVNRWAYERSATASGDTLEEPYWPNVALACQGQARLGCEREGGRNERYLLKLKAAEGDRTYDCAVDYDLWRGAALGSRWLMEVGAVLGDARCNTLQPAS